MLRYLARAILNFPKIDLLFLERFKVKASKNGSDYEYFGILKVKIPRGFTVSAQMVKGEIELRMT